ncbi:hypothetical protein [Nocardioides sp.]|uniref:hypothetical protein n=1 Tax=Nocardioides sp. TaxID=35761 RepID=UPI003784B673
MSSRRVFVVGLAAWLAVVTVGSVLVWAVVSRVGQHLEASEEPLVGAADSPVAVVEPTASGTGRPQHQPTHRPTQRPGHASPTSVPTSAVPSSVPTGATTTAPPSATGHAGPSRHPSGHASTSAPAGSSGGTTGGSTGGTTGGTAPPPAQRRTWSGAPGLVTAECRSAAVSLVAAQPSNGYQVEVEERGPARLLIQFEGTTDGHEGQTIVSARCVGGSPSFSVTRGDD